MLGSFSLSAQAQAPVPPPGAPQAPTGRGSTQPPTGRGGADQGQGRAGSPASQRPPQTATPQSYPPEQVQAGQPLFAAQCGFCHGRDAMGGETGPDLTRVGARRGRRPRRQIVPVVHNGRPDKGMPPFTLPDADLAPIVAFIHDTKAKAESLEGNRRSVDVADLQTGNAEAGQQLFQRRRRLREVPFADRRFRRLATRLQGLALMQRMLYPSGAGPRRRAAGGPKVARSRCRRARRSPARLATATSSRSRSPTRRVATVRGRRAR